MIFILATFLLLLSLAMIVSGNAVLGYIVLAYTCAALIHHAADRKR